MAVGSPLVRLMSYFDAQFRDLALRHFGGTEYQYPTLIPTSVMERCGYFQSFPHRMMLVTRLHGDIDNYRNFLASYEADTHIEAYGLSYCKNLDYCLPPTMCFHTYHQLTNESMPMDSSRVITARGKSFRFESKYQKGLERLWDFTIRETLCIGNNEYVRATLQRFMEMALEIIEENGLSGRCEVASDSFFGDPRSPEKVMSQVVVESKFELRLDVGASESIAVGSFNYIDDFLCRKFDIGFVDGTPARSGCIGFGLERLTYAFLCQYGTDESKWPRMIREWTAPDHPSP